MNAKLNRFIFVLFLGSALILGSGGASAKKPPMYLGSVAMDTPANMVERLTPLAKYLSAQTGENIVFRASPNLRSASYDLGAGYTKIAYLTPAAYLDAHEKFNVTPLASPLTHGSPTFRLMVVVKAGSGIKNVRNLVGKKFAFGDEKAIVQRAVVTQSGIKLTEFGAYAFLNHYDSIAQAVLDGSFDAGILKDSIADEYASKGLRVIHTSPPIPSYVFAVTASMPPAKAALLQKAFLALKVDNPEHKAILNALDIGYNGFAPATDQVYDDLRRLIAQFNSQK